SRAIGDAVTPGNVRSGGPTTHVGGARRCVDGGLRCAAEVKGLSIRQQKGGAEFGRAVVKGNGDDGIIYPLVQRRDVPFRMRAERVNAKNAVVRKFHPACLILVRTAEKARPSGEVVGSRMKYHRPA